MSTDITAQSTSSPASQRHIVIVTNTGWAMYRFRGWLIERLLQAGWRVTAVADYRDGYREEIAALGANPIAMSVEGSGTGPIKDLIYAAGLHALYRREKPDVVQHFTIKPVIYGTMAARLAGVARIVNTITGLGVAFGGERPILARIARLLYRMAISRRCIILFQNGDDRHRFLEAGLVTDGQSAVVAGSGIDTTVLVPDTDLGFAERSEVVMACRMLASKGVHQFIAAARALRSQFPDTKFVMIGGTQDDYGSSNPDFVDREILEDVTRQGIVDWRGRIAPEDVEATYRSAYCAVLPSFYPEGVPRSLIEAASHGIPIITTDTPGCREVVTDGQSGFLCQPRSAESLTQALEKVLSNPERAGIMGSRSRQLAQERFDAGAIFEVTMAAYEGRITDLD